MLESVIIKAHLIRLKRLALPLMTQNKTVRQIKEGILPWIVWGVACLFYFHQYFLRVSVSGMELSLEQNLHLTATMLSNVTASFFYAYIVVQVPGGILVDHYGSRAMLTAAILVTTIGCLLFASSHQIFMLEMGRVLMGAGASLAVVISLTLGRTWFSHERFVILNGLTLTVGTLGAVLGGAPFAALIAYVGWRPVMLTAGIFSFILAILAWTIVRHTPKALINPRKKICWRKTWEGICEVLSNRQVWFSGFFTGTLFLPIASFACLWGAPFLMTKYNISNSTANIGVAFMFIGLGVGGPVIGWFSNLINRYVLTMMIGSTSSLILMLSVIYSGGVSVAFVFLLLFLLGFFLGSSSLAFVIVRESTRGYDAGMAFSLTNVFQLSSGAVSLPIIGYILDVNWTGTVAHHAPVYLLSNYHKALLVMPISIILSFVFALFIREPKVFTKKHRFCAYTLARWTHYSDLALECLGAGVE